MLLLLLLLGKYGNVILRNWSKTRLEPIRLRLWGIAPKSCPCRCLLKWLHSLRLPKGIVTLRCERCPHRRWLAEPGLLGLLLKANLRGIERWLLLNAGLLELHDRLLLLSRWLLWFNGIEKIN